MYFMHLYAFLSIYEKSLPMTTTGLEQGYNWTDYFDSGKGIVNVVDGQ